VLVERLADGLFYDFKSFGFKEYPQSPASNRLRPVGPKTLHSIATGWGITLPGEGYQDGHYRYTVHRAKLEAGIPGPLSYPVDAGIFIVKNGVFAPVGSN